MLKYLIVFQFVVLLGLGSTAQVIAPTSFGDEYPIAPQNYDEYAGKAQVSFQKDPVKEKKFSILNKIKKDKAKRRTLRKKKLKKKHSKVRYKKKRLKKYKKKRRNKKLKKHMKKKFKKHLRKKKRRRVKRK